MKNILILIVVCFSSSTIFGQITDPVATEVWEPVPRVVSSPSDKFVPSDAVVLFDGKDLSAWKSAKSDGSAMWTTDGDAMTVKPGSGDIETKQSFGSIQLHIEWRSPKKVESEGQGRGNSGVFFQKRYEVQILDNYNNKTYPNGQAGSIYKQYMPLVNACRAPGEWQSYDIIFMEPEFNADGMRVRPGYLTVFHNGVLIQNHVEVQGTTEYIGLPKNIAHGDAPIMLQDHGNLVSYRNIWVRELNGKKQTQKRPKEIERQKIVSEQTVPNFSSRVVDGIITFDLPGSKKVSFREGVFGDKFTSFLGINSKKVGERFIFDNITFNIGTADLDAQSLREVAEVAKVLKAFPKVHINIEGHTDGLGDPAKNQVLALARANAVKNRLVSARVNFNRLTTQGLGSDKLLYPNNPKSKENRRIEIVITKR